MLVKFILLTTENYQGRIDKHQIWLKKKEEDLSEHTHTHTHKHTPFCGPKIIFLKCSGCNSTLPHLERANYL